jgi:hypothetical protein
MWFYDLTDRPDHGRTHDRRLSVAGDPCALHGDSDPHPEDLYAALTDPVIGLACPIRGRREGAPPFSRRPRPITTVR